MLFGPLALLGFSCILSSWASKQSKVQLDAFVIGILSAPAIALEPVILMYPGPAISMQALEESRRIMLSFIEDE